MRRYYFSEDGEEKIDMVWLYTCQIIGGLIGLWIVCTVNYFWG